jgi:hypothetical protein
VNVRRGMVQEIWTLFFDPDGDGYYDDDYYDGHNDYLIETE